MWGAIRSFHKLSSAMRCFCSNIISSYTLVEFFFLVFTVAQMSTDRSVHSAGVDEVHNVPMSVIKRPIPPVLDDNKVLSLMETIQVRCRSTT